MINIIIKKSGKIYREVIGSDEKKNVEVKSLKTHLGCNIEIEEGTTFKTLFGIILKEKEFFNEIFAEELGKTKLEDFEKQFNKKSKSVKPNSEVKHLEIFKEFNIQDLSSEDDEDNLDIIEFYSTFMGVSDDDCFVLSLVPLNELRDYEIKINNFIRVYIPDYPEDDDGDEFDDEFDNVLFEGIVLITVHEAIQAILYEISFYGNPSEKNKALKEFEKAYKKEDLMAILEMTLKKAIDEERYEDAAATQESINKLKKNNKK